MGMTFYTRGLALDSRHPRFIPLRIADRRPRPVVTCSVPAVARPAAFRPSPVVKYHGLGHRLPKARGLLMRPQLNGGTLGGRMGNLEVRAFRWRRTVAFGLVYALSLQLFSLLRRGHFEPESLLVVGGCVV